MASLHKNPRGKSPFWYAAHKTASGTRAFKSMKRTVHREALEIALNLERAECEAAVGRLNEARVREPLADTLGRVGGRVARQISIRCWLTKWLDDKIAEGSIGENSVVAYRATIRLFPEHLGKRVDESLEQIGVTDLQEFKHSRIGTGLSAKTIDRDFQLGQQGHPVLRRQDPQKLRRFPPLPS